MRREKKPFFSRKVARQARCGRPLDISTRHSPVSNPWSTIEQFINQSPYISQLGKVNAKPYQRVTRTMGRSMVSS